MRERQQTEVVIIGAGPIGLTTALLLDQFGVDHWLVEQRNAPSRHPQAHFISTRSMEIFRDVPGLEAAIRAQAPPLEQWRRYIYCTDLYHLPQVDTTDGAPKGSLLGARDHFPNGPDQELSATWECHLPQHALVTTLRRFLSRSAKARLMQGYRAAVTATDGMTVTLTSEDGKAAREVHCRYVVCADGAHGGCRPSLGIPHHTSATDEQVFISIHFFSPELSELLAQRILGMLYFIYSPAGVGVLVSHDLAAGEFVLQLPLFPPHQAADAFSKSVCAELIDRLTGAPVSAAVRSVRPWRLGAWVAARYQSVDGRGFIVGDAAHEFLPAGGFGQNCGIADAHNLAWKLAVALKTAPAAADSTPPLLATYTSERRPVAKTLLALSGAGYQQTLAVAAAIGLDKQLAHWLDLLIRVLPLPAGLGRRLFTMGMRLGLRQVALLGGRNPLSQMRWRRLARLFADPSANLAMRYPRQDLGAVYDRGWFASAATADAAARDGTGGDTGIGFTPTLVNGGRLPHFWLLPWGADRATPLSSLDLPSLIARRHGSPVHLLLMIDIAAKLGRRLAALQRQQYGEIERVAIRTDAETTAPADFVLQTTGGGYRPRQGAILVRPDGVVAWRW